MSNKRIKALINLKNAKKNIENLYNHMDSPAPIMCVIKANGYGHGAVRLAKMYETMKEVCGYATATAEEALELRKAGLKKRILILGPVFCDDYAELLLNDISLTVFTYEAAKEINAVAHNINKIANIHIKVDTGMSRIGVFPNESGLEIVKKIDDLSNVTIQGLFTHFARADEINKDRAYAQLEKYNDFANKIEACGINIPIKHCSNSAALLEMPEARFDMVRAGIVLYGLWPSDEVNKDKIELLPVMSLVSHVSYVKNLVPNTQISYGGTFETCKQTRVATVPVGYADGYPRQLSNKGKVIINGAFAPILGRVCMDQLMVDVSDIEGVETGSEVILMGSDGSLSITAEEIGEESGRFNYELVCDITARVPREYIE